MLSSFPSALVCRSQPRLSTHSSCMSPRSIRSSRVEVSRAGTPPSAAASCARVCGLSSAAAGLGGHQPAWHRASLPSCVAARPAAIPSKLAPLRLLPPMAPACVARRRCLGNALPLPACRRAVGVSLPASPRLPRQPFCAGMLAASVISACLERRLCWQGVLRSCRARASLRRPANPPVAADPPQRASRTSAGTAWRATTM